MSNEEKGEIGRGGKRGEGGTQRRERGRELYLPSGVPNPLLGL